MLVVCKFGATPPYPTDIFIARRPKLRSVNRLVAIPKSGHGIFRPSMSPSCSGLRGAGYLDSRTSAPGPRSRGLCAVVEATVVHYPLEGQRGAVVRRVAGYASLLEFEVQIL